jgi:uncharacterized membrane protein
MAIDPERLRLVEREIEHPEHDVSEPRYLLVLDVLGAFGLSLVLVGVCYWLADWWVS